MHKRLVVLVALVLVSTIPVGVWGQTAPVDVTASPSGPPPFVTFPILTRVGEPGLEHGHFVFGGEAAIPAPLEPDRGFASYLPAETAAGTLTLGGGLDADVSGAPDSYEGETGAAASNGPLIVGGSNHIYPGNCSTSAASGAFGDCAPLAYASSDGMSWTKTALPRDWNGTTFGIGFDPSVDVDKDGNFYYSYGVAPLSGSYPNGIVVAKSSDGVHWTKLTPVTFNTSKNFDDKYYLAVDRSTSFPNRIYVAWDRNTANNQILYVAHSSDGGASWSAPVKVNDGKSKFERVIGAYPAIDQSNGTVYVSWHDYARDRIVVDKSIDGGNTWGQDVDVATTHTGFGQDIGCVGGRSQGPAHALKVGPTGALYLVYADQVVNRGFDVLLTKSTDGGATWTSPVTLNDDTGAADQFHPTLTVESGSGGDKVTVTFYDRRDDSSNCLAHVYATRSTDGGATWTANVRQTTAPSNFDGNPNGPGDYSSSTAFNSGVWPFFSDHRASDFKVYTAEVALGTPPPTVSIASPTDGISVNSTDSILFEASATGVTGTPSWRWSSDLEGLLDTSSNFSRSLTKAGTQVITASVTDSATGQTGSATVTVTVLPVGASFMGVNAITPGGKRNLSVTVNIRTDSNSSGGLDSTDTPVSGATVTFDLKQTATGTVWTFVGQTNSSGDFKGTLVQAPSGSYQATVTNVTHGSYSWDPSLTNVSGNSLTFSH
jgi:hypothetical protein